MRVTRIAAALAASLAATLAVIGTAAGSPIAPSAHRAHGHDCSPTQLTAPAGFRSRDPDLRATGTFAPIGDMVSRHPKTTVDVYAHVLRTDEKGGVPRWRIERQLTVMNQAYAGAQSSRSATAPFRFVLAGVDVTRNRRWYRMDEGSGAEAQAKRALHRGGPADLNLYIGANSAGLLGWGTQPTRLSGSPLMDGVVIARHTMPAGKGGRYSSGDTAVHETGHWLGLFHTYTGKCTERGDLVADTPREARPAYECPKLRDTCTAPGKDPVHNFMDAGTDACMNQFTSGQVSRMIFSFDKYRAAVIG